MKEYILSAIVIVAAFICGALVGTHNAEERYRQVVEDATKQREAERDSLLEENQNAWAKEAENRRALESANASIRSLTERLRNNTRADRVPEAAAASIARLKADNARLRKLLGRCTEFLDRSAQEYGACAASHDAAVDLYQAARK